ncbi:MAG: signal recognition particle-docking protein FtsY, partial [Succinivibrionaceae bacterium]|nr:signal recognition particle-docking protein FtsY [Succinivibrionaceae bacterium]
AEEAAARKAAEEAAAKQAAEEAAARKAAEEAAARKAAEEAAAKKAAEEAAKKAAEEAAARKAAEEAAKKAAEEAAAKQAAEEAAAKKAAQAAARKAAREAAAKKAAEEAAAKKAAKEAARKAAAEKAAAEAEAKRVAEEAAQKQAAEEEAARKAAEEAAQRQAEEERAKAKKTQDKPHRPSFFERLKKTRDNLAAGFSALLRGGKIDEDLYEELETALLTADLGVETTEKVIERLREESHLYELADAAALKANLRKILVEIVRPCAVPLVPRREEGPFVILMVGVNGAGKTTTIGKLAQQYQGQGLKVMLAAGDTFRAAAVSQLEEWGARIGVPVIAQATGSDSASVLYDALQAATARHYDVLICDTAGRLQNKDHLMEELRKIVRVMGKQGSGAPHEVMMVLDAATGQNAVSQVRIFSQAVSLSGLVVSKLDGSAKGGIVFALSDEFKLPIRYVGIGEGVDDLREFDAGAFVDALFEADHE